MKKKLLTKKEQTRFVYLLGELLLNGFSISQALSFFENSQQFPEKVTQLCQTKLTAGLNLATILSDLAFPSQQVLQVELAQSHGNLAQTLLGISQQRRLLLKQKENFIKAISYPLVLLLFLTLILLGMQFFLLPQLLASGMLTSDSLAVVFIQKGPWFLLGLIILLGLLWLSWRYFSQKHGYLERLAYLIKIPLLKNILKDYYSAYFALEWGKLFNQGLELQQIITCLLATKKNSLMAELAGEMQTSLQDGISLAQQLQSFPFLTREFSQIILQGEARGNLGKELLLYSEILWQRFFKRIEFLITWVQPLIFLLVALLIVSIYVAMLLPLTNGLEGI